MAVLHDGHYAKAEMPVHRRSYLDIADINYKMIK
jgi:hypothetical protein